MSFRTFIKREKKTTTWPTQCAAICCECATFDFVASSLMCDFQLQLAICIRGKGQGNRMCGSKDHRMCSVNIYAALFGAQKSISQLTNCMYIVCVCVLCVCVCVCVYNTCLLSLAVASCRHVTCVCCAEPPTLRKQHLPPSC